MRGHISEYMVADTIVENVSFAEFCVDVAM